MSSLVDELSSRNVYLNVYSTMLPNYSVAKGLIKFTQGLMLADASIRSNIHTNFLLPSQILSVRVCDFPAIYSWQK